MLVDEAPADEALALRLTVARHAAPQLLAVMHIVVEDVVRDLLLRVGVKGWGWGWGWGWGQGQGQGLGLGLGPCLLGE